MMLHGCLSLLSSLIFTNFSKTIFYESGNEKLPIAGFHSFKNGAAFMDIRLLSLFTVQYESGQDMGIAETVTFLTTCVVWRRQH